MAQQVAGPLAEVEAQTRGPLLAAAVLAGEALFEYPGQLLRGDAHARVLDDEGFPLGIDGHAALLSVFEGVAQQLAHDEAQPLFVRQHGEARGGEGHGQLFQDEEPRIRLHGGADDVVQGAPAQHQIRGVAPQPLIGQHQVHILLHAEQLPLEQGHVRRLALQQQPHGRQRGLDLVDPGGVEGLGPIPLGGGGRGDGAPVLVQGGQHILIIRLRGVRGVRQGRQPLPELGQGAAKGLVPPPIAQKAHRQEA